MTWHAFLMRICLVGVFVLCIVRCEIQSRFWKVLVFWPTKFSGFLQECNGMAQRTSKQTGLRKNFGPGQQKAPGRNSISFASLSGQLHRITCYFTVYQKCIFILWEPCLERLEAILKMACFGLLLNFAMGVGGHGEKKTAFLIL